MSSELVHETDARSQVLLHKLNSALSSDFCSWANRYVYWLKNPFWVLVLAIAGSITCGVFLNPLVFALTAVLVTVTAAGVVLPCVAIRGIDCRVAFDVQRTRVGNPAIVRLIVRNRLPVPVWTRVCSRYRGRQRRRTGTCASSRMVDRGILVGV